ncbi:MAG: helix-turn-helix transcriptional regulator [Cyclobacteriaceae bacterium]|nr:helix-turn-helix transcriptional regulator [Cyclobacteriaceae bacterium]
MNTADNRLYIRNMVCDRCIMAVQTALARHHLAARQVSLGVVDLVDTPAPGQLQSFRQDIESIGFELLEDQTARMISEIRQIAMAYARSEDNKVQQQKLSVYVGRQLGKDFDRISALFSNTEGITLEQFVIRHKIEYVKELLVYDQQTLSEIADRLGYSSVQHLSSQFRKITGMTPTEFRANGQRQPLDRVGR